MHTTTRAAASISPAANVRPQLMVTDAALAGLDAKGATALVLAACDLDQDLCKSPFGEMARKLAELVVPIQWAIAAAAGRPLTREQLQSVFRLQCALDLASDPTTLPADTASLRAELQRFLDDLGANAAWAALPPDRRPREPERLYGFVVMHFSRGFAGTRQLEDAA
ncbi:hypothetical protein JMJ56_29755 [Belnapia sp. T18]|uniref:Uncharacterized protein n=1 Tax=Belnapia arida TaxID=2804533 RepID=A0ABS1UDE9_9PROT|nr:hypothetical protein [Belnapia arida]MBL6082165.1 hypothetical protein [Belnapia arida]